VEDEQERHAESQHEIAQFGVPVEKPLHSFPL
jgi:hypothetical protein